MKRELESERKMSILKMSDTTSNHNFDFSQNMNLGVKIIKYLIFILFVFLIFSKIREPIKF